MSIKLLLIIADIIGVPVTAWIFFLKISAWKENVIVGLIASLWAFKLGRAIVRAVREDQEKRIELREKRKRYNNDLSD